MAHILVGTRGSELAFTQCSMLVEELKIKNPDHTFELKIIKTTGDLNRTTPLTAFGSQGVFVKELENALLDGEIHCAVHSLKDVPHMLPAGLEISIYSKRENPYDVLISNGKSITELPHGARVGTGSVRRKVMLHALRPDLEFVEIRGNVGTRIEKVMSGELDATILASAGLNRLSLNNSKSYEFSVTELVPAIAQGVLGIETRCGDSEIHAILNSVNDPDAKRCMEIERGFMEQIGGGCKAPMAAFARHDGALLIVDAMIANQKTFEIVRFHKRYTAQSVQNIIDEMTHYFIRECAHKKIPLPSELEEHTLLK